MGIVVVRFGGDCGGGGSSGGDSTNHGIADHGTNFCDLSDRGVDLGEAKFVVFFLGFMSFSWIGAMRVLCF